MVRTTIGSPDPDVGVAVTQYAIIGLDPGFAGGVNEMLAVL